MKVLIALLSVPLFILGYPIAGLLFIVVAIGMAPSGRRVDGKRRNGGLLGPLFDELAAPEKPCSACRAVISKKALICPHCRSLLGTAR